MLPQPRLSTRALQELCHRLAVETDAGIDIRRTWQREAENAPALLRPILSRVRDGVAGGQSLSLALAGAGRVFPPLFLEMVRVGEESGTLGSVFRRLESHYRRSRQAQRIFLGAIAWPMFELAFAIVVIGGLVTSTLLTLVVLPVLYRLFDTNQTRESGGDEVDGRVAAEIGS